VVVREPTVLEVLVVLEDQEGLSVHWVHCEAVRTGAFLHFLEGNLHRCYRLFCLENRYFRFLDKVFLRSLEEAPSEGRKVGPSLMQ
jgi:hypothetical protein